MDEHISVQDKKQIVVEFLRHCNDYADAKILGYKTRFDADLGGATSEELMLLADKISHWSAYRAFNDLAISELETVNWMIGSPHERGASPDRSKRTS